MQVPLGLTHRTKVNVTNQYWTIRSGVSWGTDDHKPNIQGPLVLSPVKYSSQLFVLVATTSKGIES